MTAATAFANPTNAAVAQAEVILKHLDYEKKFFEKFVALSYTEQNEALRAEPGIRGTLEAVPTELHVATQWRKEGRQCLAIHPELASEIINAKMVGIVVEALATLPYMNPMVVFPEPVIVPSYEEGCHQEVIGMIYYGATDHHRLCETTHAPDVDTIGAMFITRLIDGPAAGVQEINRLTIPTNSATELIEDVVKDKVLKYQWQQGVTKNRAQAERYLAELMQVLVGVTMYLCSTTLDVEMVPRTTVKHTASFPTLRKPINLMRVGWNVGPALTNARRQWSEKEGLGPGRMRGPEHRRCHYRHVWCGPGKTQRRWTFIAPYWTHREMLGESGTNTVRAVPRPKPRR